MNFFSIYIEQSDEEQSDEEVEHSEVEQSEEEQQTPTTQRRSTRQSPNHSLRRRSRRNQSDDSDAQPLRPKRSVKKRQFTQDDDSCDEEVSTSTRRTATTITHQVN